MAHDPLGAVSFTQTLIRRIQADVLPNARQAMARGRLRIDDSLRRELESNQRLAESADPRAARRAPAPRVRGA
jgi:hypothetical protein